MLRMLPRVTAVLAVLAVASCGGGPSGDLVRDTTIYVDGMNGIDQGTGTAAAPFRTISHALQVVQPGGKIRVEPWVYDANHGELFPLVVPPQVRVTGDVANRGGVDLLYPTYIDGGAIAYLAGWAPVTTIRLSGGARLEGFCVSNPEPTGLNQRVGVLIEYEDVVVERCTIEDCDLGIHCASPPTSSGVAILDNIVRDNGTGIDFAFNPGSVRVSANWVQGNAYGVWVNDGGPDLGGGAAGSPGLNYFLCNGKHLFVQGDSSNCPYTAYAESNYWDELPLVIVDHPISPGHIVITDQGIVPPPSVSTLPAYVGPSCP